MGTNSEKVIARRRLVSKQGVWHWENESGAVAIPLPSRPDISLLGDQLNPRRWSRLAQAVNRFVRTKTGMAIVLATAFLLGVIVASGPNSAAANLRLRERLHRAEGKLKARQGELGLARMELARLTSIIDHSRRYGIPADLATSIYDIALSEGIDPKIAFALVSVESDFLRRAVSNKGAVGLTQVMPSTARLMDPSLRRSDLFDRETNLRLGFRFLRELLAYYKGDLTLALTAYNRGPTRVDEIRKAGGDPNNGYARSVLRAGQRP